MCRYKLGSSCLIKGKCGKRFNYLSLESLGCRLILGVIFIFNNNIRSTVENIDGLNTLDCAQ